MANFTFSKLSSKIPNGDSVTMNLLCNLEQAETGADIIAALEAFDYSRQPSSESVSFG